MLTWAVSKYVIGTGWVTDGTVLAPRGQGFSEPINSTIDQIILADGSKSVVIPESKYNTDSIRFYWYKVTSTVKSKLETYVKNSTGLKFTTHVSGKTFEGYITNIESEWIIGTSKELYSISVDFLPKTVA